MPILENKKAKFDYHLSDSLQCGMILTGDQVKEFRNKTVSSNNLYAFLKDGSLYLNGIHFSESGDPTIKLLIRKQEIKSLIGKVSRDGYTLVPTKIFWKGSLIKAEVCLGKGKKLFDKREDIKKREQERDINRQIKNNNR